MNKPILNCKNLPKDCGCVIHEGPHWLHYDRVIQGLNLKMLRERLEANGGRLTYLDALAFAREEVARLREKGQHLDCVQAQHPDQQITVPETNLPKKIEDEIARVLKEAN